MHNIIIENESGKDFDYTFYETIGQPVQPRRREDQIRRFLEVYHGIPDSDRHVDLQKYLIEELWAWHGQQDHYVIDDELCCYVY